MPTQFIPYSLHVPDFKLPVSPETTPVGTAEERRRLSHQAGIPRRLRIGEAPARVESLNHSGRRELSRKRLVVLPNRAKAVTDKHFSPPNLPAHIEETVRSLAQLHADHHRNATPHERAVARTTALLAHPRFIGGLAIVVAAWMTLNLLAAPLGYPALDPPPFSWLGSAVSLVSLYMMVLILATQRRDDQLTQRREQLTLELAVLIEQKTAKIIQLLEESRRDNPQVQNRHDPEAEAMAQPADPESVLVAIRDTHAINNFRRRDAHRRIGTAK